MQVSQKVDSPGWTIHFPLPSYIPDLSMPDFCQRAETTAGLKARPGRLKSCSWVIPGIAKRPTLYGACRILSSDLGRKMTEEHQYFVHGHTLVGSPVMDV
jgi:hypothetical protein